MVGSDFKSQTLSSWVGMGVAFTATYRGSRDNEQFTVIFIVNSALFLSKFFAMSSSHSQTFCGLYGLIRSHSLGLKFFEMSSSQTCSPPAQTCSQTCSPEAAGPVRHLFPPPPLTQHGRQMPPLGHPGGGGGRSLPFTLG